MEKKYDLTDIENAISKALDNPELELIASGTIGAIGLFAPVAGVITQAGYELLSKYNDFRLSLLLRGLSKGLNISMRLNDLYNYVTSSSENALRVCNVFRQTLNAESPKACIIYGLVLANHTASKTSLSHEELIVCKALENATDYDLINFKEIMKNHVVQKGTRKKVNFADGCINKAELTMTCDWCSYNRIFKHGEQEWVDELGDGNVVVETPYYIASTAEVLLRYIDAANQIWGYGTN